MLNMNRRSVLAIVFGLVLSVSTTTRADIAPDPLSGGKNLSVLGKEKTNVEMVDEVLKLHLSKFICHVDVVFTMKNIGNAPEEMEVGFPGNYEDEMKKFSAKVDGTSVKVSQKAETRMEPYMRDRENNETIYRERTTQWKTWKMTFPPDKPVKIHVTYFTELRDNRWRRQYELPVAEHLAAYLPPKDRAKLEAKLASRKIDYYLRTGSHWSGPIGNCRIEVTFNGLTADNIDLSKPFFERERATITDDKIVWDLKDYEPKQDIEFSITPGTTAKTTLALLEKAHMEHPEAVDITIILSEFLAAANRREESDKLVLELLKQWQDKITFWGEESDDTRQLQNASHVFHLIVKRTDERFGSVKFLRPAEFVPVFEHIARRVQGQTKLAPPLYKDEVSLYVKDVDQILAWCRKHAKAE